MMYILFILSQISFKTLYDFFSTFQLFVIILALFFFWLFYNRLWIFHPILIKFRAMQEILAHVHIFWHSLYPIRWRSTAVRILELIAFSFIQSKMIQGLILVGISSCKARKHVVNICSHLESSPSMTCPSLSEFILSIFLLMCQLRANIHLHASIFHPCLLHISTYF